MAGASLLQKWQLLQTIIAAPNLSATAKVVAARILDYFHSQTGRCCPSYQALADGTGLKRRAVIYAVQELEEGRWITVDRVKGGASASAGRYATNAFRIDFSRVGSEASTVHGDAPSRVHGDAPSTVHGGAPESIDITGKETGKTPPTPSAFDEWWEVYPRKVAKDAARRIFDRVVRDRRATVEDLIASARRYATETASRDPEHVKHPSTWLNGGCWADEPAIRRASVPEAHRGDRRRGGYSATRDWLLPKVDSDV